MPKFRDWCITEDKKYNVIEAVERASSDFPRILCDLLSTAFRIPVNFEKVYWKDTVDAFVRLHSVTSSIRKIPITSAQAHNKDEKDIWDYSGRLWPMYMSIFASAYGWSEKQISNLTVNNALTYLQEILTEKQLEREFIWSTSERAYPVDATTKRSRFSPLSRPYWMQKQKEDRKPAPVPKSLLPVGNIIRLHETKET